jgi:type IV pilus assembly protein PilC
MIAVGEETGDIDGMLIKIAEFYESEVDAAVKALSSIIEPLMIVVVGGIIVAMYLPMFKIFELIE